MTTKTKARRMLSTNRAQIIGDRAVINPRIVVAELRDASGEVCDEVELSLELCGCGYSYARGGVGYWHPDGWVCKRCGQLHTLREGVSEGDPELLRPDPDQAARFDREASSVDASWIRPEELRGMAVAMG